VSQDERGSKGARSKRARNGHGLVDANTVEMTIHGKVSFIATCQLVLHHQSIQKRKDDNKQANGQTVKD